MNPEIADDFQFAKDVQRQLSQFYVEVPVSTFRNGSFVSETVHYPVKSVDLIQQEQDSVRQRPDNGHRRVVPVGADSGIGELSHDLSDHVGVFEIGHFVPFS